MNQFPKFPKVPRYSRECIITEKIDGTNASVHIIDSLRAGYEKWPMDKVISAYGSGDNMIYMFAGSRKRFITPDDDNFGFAMWVQTYADELIKLNAGSHYGEWWGRGIQRGYGLDHKRFSLFNVNRWYEPREWRSGAMDQYPTEDRTQVPDCCHVVPILDIDIFGKVDYAYADTDSRVEGVMMTLKDKGSQAAPGFMNPEGIMIYHTAANQLFKKTFEKDDTGKEE